MPLPGVVARQQIKKRLQGLNSDQKIAEINSILDELPDVGDYRIIKSELKKQQDAEKGIVSIRHSSKGKYYVKKESPQSMIIGLPNSGKSTLLAALTNADVKIADYPFTTQVPEVASMAYNDIRTQLIELPAFYKNVSVQNKELISLLRTTDVIINVIKDADELDILLGELEDSKIRPYNRKVEKYEKYSEKYTFIPSIVAYRNEKPKTALEAINIEDLNRIAEELFRQLSITRIYFRDIDNHVTTPPMMFIDMDEITVEDVARRIDKHFMKSFKYAKIWGPSANYDGEKVGLKAKISDTDIVTIYSKV